MKCKMRNGFLDKLKAKTAVGLIAVVLETTIAAIIAVPVTKWFIQVNNATVQTEDRMTSMNIAYNKWQDIVYQPFDDIAEFAGKTKKEDAFSGQYEITTTYGNIQKVSADKDQRYMECTVSVNKKNALPTDRPYSMKGKKIELDVAGPLQMPDYDHGMLLDDFRVGGNAVTAPERGYFYVFIYRQRTGSGDDEVMDGNVYTIMTTPKGTTHLMGVNTLIPVEKETTIQRTTVNGHVNASAIYFFPVGGSHSGEISTDGATIGGGDVSDAPDNTIPIVAIIPYNGSLSDIPSGWALCDGTNGTPDLRDKFVMGWGSNSANTYKTAGLPNIEGSTISNDGEFPYTPFAVGFIGEDNDKYSSGALYLRKTPNRNIMGLNGLGTSNMDREDAYLAFDASRSNSIYGNSSTVQPPAYVVFYIMKVS